jgi:hypothetical protein
MYECATFRKHFRTSLVGRCISVVFNRNTDKISPNYRINATNVEANPALRLVTSTLVAFMLAVSTKFENANHISNPQATNPPKKNRGISKKHY